MKNEGIYRLCLEEGVLPLSVLVVHVLREWRLSPLSPWWLGDWWLPHHELVGTEILKSILIDRVVSHWASCYSKIGWALSSASLDQRASSLAMPWAQPALSLAMPLSSASLSRPRPWARPTLSLVQPCSANLELGQPWAHLTLSLARLGSAQFWAWPRSSRSFPDFISCSG